MPRYDFKKICVIEEDFGEVFAETCGCNSKPASLCSGFGEGGTQRLNGQQIVIKLFTITNANRMKVKLLTWGATILSIKCPDKYGEVADVVLGFDDLKGYLDPTVNQFMGCVLGRCANRIRDGTFKLKDNEYFLTKNDLDKHHWHGGTNGFGRRIWESYVDENCNVVMSYLSEDGEEGYPGAVLTTLRFKLTNDNRLEINMRASTSKPTIVNLSHGPLFNLAGHCAGEAELRKHEISLNCNRWTVADSDDYIPIGTIRGVGGTIMDLRVPKLFGELIDNVPGSKGFDHNFCVLKSSQPVVSFVGKVFHEHSGRFLEVYSDQPGVQLYTAGGLPPYPYVHPDPELNSNTTSSENYECGENCDCESDKVIEFIPGKCGAQYTKFCAFSLQPQNYPDAINIPHFPRPVLSPGQVYYHDMVYKFGVQLQSSECKKQN